MTERLTVEETLGRIAALAEELADDPRVGELLDWVDAFHREGLGRVVEMARDWRGDIFVEALAADEVAGHLLAAYGFAPGDQAVAPGGGAVQTALAEVRPYLRSHGGDLEVVSVQDGIVMLERHGSCDGCTDIAVTIADRLDPALRRHWDDYRRVELVPSSAAPHPAPVAGQISTGLQIGRRPA